MLAQTIAHYRILRKIGAGGMGEVYRAQDTRLSRDVALKVLPEAFASDTERMARFEREAKLLASLNHPNIASIFGLEESDGTRALVMELVEGSTLAERVAKGPLPLEEALSIARQIAEGLEFAHERNIIHRDLKPSNVKLTADGQVKILDFGLAKALEDEATQESLGTSPTLTNAATRAGVLLGTAAYMSPEQARGKRIDRRADVWAFGCVLYEMLSGRNTFAGETTSDILAGVIRAEPDWSCLPGSVPARIRELLRRCLQKDPKQRLQSIGEARITLDAAIAGSVDEATNTIAVSQSPLWHRAAPWVVSVGAVLLAIAVSLLSWRAGLPEPRNVMRASLSLQESLAGVFQPNPGSSFAISSDGTRLVYAGSSGDKPQQLYLHQFSQQSDVPMPGTNNAIQPFFSPDDQWIGFFADGKLCKVSIKGGAPSVLADALIPHGATWLSDDTIIYAPNLGSGLMRVSSSGGTPQTLTTRDASAQELSHRWPQVLPGNAEVLFTIQTGTQSTYEEARISLLSLKTGKWRTLFEGGTYARYVPSGHIVYAHGGGLMAVPFDLARLRLSGPATLVQEGVINSSATSGGAEYDVTPSGFLAYVPGNARPPNRSLVWVDRQGVGKELPAPAKAYMTPRISPDGKLCVVQILGPGPQDFWVYEFGRNTLMRLTFNTGIANPTWTPDSRRIIFRSRIPDFSIRWKLADGGGTEEQLVGSELGDPAAAPIAVSPDGKTLLVARHATPDAPTGYYALSLNGSRKVQPYIQFSFVLFQAQFSPDGHWVAYTANETGHDEVYVQPFPATGGKWMVSNGGGSSPVWPRNGREIFYRRDDKVMAVPVETQPTFRAGTPHALFQSADYRGPANYDAAPDGQHFLMLKEKEAPSTAQELAIVLNWNEELKRLAPVSPRP